MNISQKFCSFYVQIIYRNYPKCIQMGLLLWAVCTDEGSARILELNCKVFTHDDQVQAGQPLTHLEEMNGQEQYLNPQGKYEGLIYSRTAVGCSSREATFAAFMMLAPRRASCLFLPIILPEAKPQGRLGKAMGTVSCLHQHQNVKGILTPELRSPPRYGHRWNLPSLGFRESAPGGLQC